MKNLSKSLIRMAIMIITTLLVLNFILTRRNARVIEENRALHQEAEQVKVMVSQFAIVIIHNLDLGMRSYALFNEEKYLYPLHIAIQQKDSILQSVEQVLHKQGYALEEFHLLRDSINAYATLNLELLDLFQHGERAEFRRLANQDRGYRLWLQYEALARKINDFEDHITDNTQNTYRKAERNNLTIQVLLFLFCVPTLFFTAYQTYREFAYEVKLLKTEQEKSHILSTQNERLEQAVEQRTREILEKNRALQTQHEEIAAQNEEIITQNDELHRHREELSLQNKALTQSKKEQLDLYSQTLHEKSEFIIQLSNEIESLRKRPTPGQEQMAHFSKVLHATILTEEDWKKFKRTFEEVYPNFFASLRFRFPDVTASEQRLAALIKMNLSLKEAASTLGISTESVKKSRYRLKKKIAPGEEDSLEDFIRGL